MTNKSLNENIKYLLDINEKCPYYLQWLRIISNLSSEGPDLSVGAILSGAREIFRTGARFPLSPPCSVHTARPRWSYQANWKIQGTFVHFNHHHLYLFTRYHTYFYFYSNMICFKFAWLLSSVTIITDYYKLLRPPGWWLGTPVITI